MLNSCTAQDGKVNPCGPGCVIAAGAVVTRDAEPDGLYAGVPARRIRSLR